MREKLTKSDVEKIQAEIDRINGVAAADGAS